MQNYSQSNQDLYVYENYFKNKPRGVFVDIGAHDGKTLSNTLFYENLGWEGICIEPLPSIYKKLILTRKCKCVCGAISDKDTDTVEFNAIEGYAEMLSGIADNYDPRHSERVTRELVSYGGSKSTIKVPNFKFNELIDYTHIDFLSVDTEGNELNILKTIDFNKYVIDVITVENNFAESHLADFLCPLGYELVTRLEADFLFKKKV